ncbi:MAG: arginine deiminase [Bacteroidales bacterium]|nr:arginine deiminase [Bacteroidales bacterium]MCF8458531.1 arginine deiminase [Bacteroidales bacterium]
MRDKLSVQVNSEVGELEGVIVHTLGKEVENMTPENAERALYSDILNLNVALKEFEQLKQVLQKVTKTFEVGDLLGDILQNEKVKQDLILKICKPTDDCEVAVYLSSLPSQELAQKIIEGVVLKRDNLSRYLSKQRFAIQPLHNFFYTRDAAISLFDNVLIGRMASKVRERESMIMEAIFDYHPGFKTSTLSKEPDDNPCHKITLEGGDILVAREDIILIGIGARTSPQGVDFIIEKMKAKNKDCHIIVQELPTDRESFIHLDMVFTLLNRDECMVYEPVIMQPNRYKTIHISIDNKKVKICEKTNILDTLRELGMDMKPIYCGGQADTWNQEREQWHSGANFFAVGPGKVIGYGRNVYTIDELNKNGYEVVRAIDIIKDKVNIADIQKYVVTIEGSELSRGGGGARCMTMPVRRKAVD